MGLAIPGVAPVIKAGFRGRCEGGPAGSRDAFAATWCTFGRPLLHSLALDGTEIRSPLA